MIPAPKQEHLAPGTMAEGTICVHPEWAMIRDMAKDPALGNHSGEEGKTMREEAKTKPLLQLLRKRRKWQPYKVHVPGAAVTFLTCSSQGN